MKIIEFKKVSKKFGNFFANQELSFSVEKGTIHGLIGENGAGKSTAMKVLFGMDPLDEGEIFIREKATRIQNPIQAMKLGIGMVHQHFMLAETETVLDNIILGQEPCSFFGFLDREKAKKQLVAIAENYGLSFSKWHEPIAKLSVGEQQRVEILKLLYQKSEVLILDEPTAVLTPQEVKELFTNLKRLRSEGKTIILISHKLKEVLEYTDQVTVMRRGKVMDTLKTGTTNEDALAEMMVGRKVSFTYQGARKIQASQVSSRPVLRVSNLSLNQVHESLKQLEFNLFAGEILGVAGVQGNGQSELFRFLSHPAMTHDQQKGEYFIHGKEVSLASPFDLRKMGVGMVPEDRLSEGLFLHQDMTENFLLGQQQDSRYVSRGRIHRKTVVKEVEKKIREFDIRPPFTTVWAGKMSGGNQQKLLMARALDPKPSVLFIAHPTRGVDVGAIEKIHETIMEERNQGKAILLLSSELDELMDLSDRILVFFEGRIHATFARSEFDSWAIGRTMGGGTK